jgi:predicted ATP-grasp superfamily ATP-dependent carboligase
MNRNGYRGDDTAVEIVVFSGFNQRAVIAFLRTLARHRLPFSVIAASPGDPIFQTVYRRAVRYVRRSVPIVRSDMLAAVRKIKVETGCKRMFIAPTTESLNRYVLQNRCLFEREGCIVPLPDERLYARISDKYSFGSLCRRYGISVPGEYMDPSVIEFPCVAKPRQYVIGGTGSSLSPVILGNERELGEFIHKNVNGDFYLQEYIPGRSFYLLYYISRDGEIIKCSQENLMQQPGGKSILAAVSSDIHEHAVSSGFEHLLREIGYRGLIMMEVRGGDGQYTMIEANPRLWGPSQLFIDAGVDLFEYFLSDYELIDRPSGKPHTFHKHKKYYWHGGLVAVLNAGGEITYHAYSESLYNADKGGWMSSDIYNRPDTEEVYALELEKAHAESSKVTAAL